MELKHCPSKSYQFGLFPLPWFLGVRVSLAFHSNCQYQMYLPMCNYIYIYTCVYIIFSATLYIPCTSLGNTWDHDLSPPFPPKFHAGTFRHLRAVWCKFGWSSSWEWIQTAIEGRGHWWNIQPQQFRWVECTFGQKQGHILQSLVKDKTQDSQKHFRVFQVSMIHDVA